MGNGQGSQCFDGGLTDRLLFSSQSIKHGLEEPHITLQSDR